LVGAVVDGAELDGLRHVPVAAGEGQRRQQVVRHPVRRVVARFPGEEEFKVLEAAGLAVRPQVGDDHVDPGVQPGGRRAGQADGVGVVLPPFAPGGRPFGDAGNATAFGDDDVALLVIDHVGRNAVGGDAVVERVGTFDAVEDDAAVAFEVVGDDGDGAALRGAADGEGVGAQAAVELGDDLDTRGEHEEAVVAFGAGGPQLFDVDVADVEARAEPARVGHAEVAGELGADHAHRVEAVPAVDVHRGAGDVEDGVGAGVPLDVGAGALRVDRA